MTPQEYEWADEQAERAYRCGQIGPEEFRKRLCQLGMSDRYITYLITEIDRQIAANPRGARIR